jgi:hypothetical protein
MRKKRKAKDKGHREKGKEHGAKGIGQRAEGRGRILECGRWNEKKAQSSKLKG